MPSSYSAFYAADQILLRKLQLGTSAQGSRLRITVASVRDAASETAVTHTDGNKIFKFRKCILGPEKFYFIYPHNSWPLGKLGLKQLDWILFCFCTLRIRRTAVTSIVAVLFMISRLARQQHHGLTVKTWLIMDGNHGKPWFDHGQLWTLKCA